MDNRVDPGPKLAFGLSFSDLANPARLADLDGLFLESLQSEPNDLAARFIRYREGEPLSALSISFLLVETARPLSRFVARLFGIEAERAEAMVENQDDAVLFKFRWSVFQRRIIKKYPSIESIEALDASRVDLDGLRLVSVLNEGERAAATRAVDEERRLAQAGWDLFDLSGAIAPQRSKEATYELAVAFARIERLRTLAAEAGLVSEGTPEILIAAWSALFDTYAARLNHAPEHHARTSRWACFSIPRPVRFDALVPTLRPRPDFPEARVGLPSHSRARAGFTLTDSRKTERQVTGEVHYCLLCHDRDKDSCSKGFPTKEGGFKKNPLGVVLNGCPLDEKISEMHLLRREGDSIGALALICIDNPMCPGTGHRICNDCMKGCIFQNQDAVDIPQAETGVLTDVLQMPWGFEIWSFLTRWNPLNRSRPYALPYNGRNVLVVGAGPAGYTLAHHLVNDGFGVVAIDGLKIEPLPAELVGTDDVPPRPVRIAGELFRRLDERPLTGFGGVSEYGITVRWDKNFLDLLYLNLARRRTFRIIGGVRFGGTITTEQAVELGFDHIAIAAGAGKPTLVDMKNNLIRGVRQASDFLMGLQLTGAFKKESLANLQVELPIVVIGGGLTAIDTATESLAYYAIQVEKLLERFEALEKELGDAGVFAGLSVEEKMSMGRQLEHGRAIRSERRRAERAGETPDFARLCKLWGGATLAYRRPMEESPAYRLNHEEIIKALEEGIVFAENLEPTEAVADEFGSLSAVVFKRKDGTSIELPCRTLLIAAGTSPNITYERELPGSFPLDDRKKFFRPHVAVRGENGSVELISQPDGVDAFFTGASVKGRFVTYFGDNHPVYAGSVVKAMASAKLGAPKIRELFADELDRLSIEAEDVQIRTARWRTFAASLDELLRPRVVRVDRLTPTIVEVIVKAPLAARNFRPGQFYRFQNFEASAAKLSGTAAERPSPLLLEPCALTGAWVDKEQGLLSMIALELGVSSRLCATLKPGEPVIVMGPTGAPTELPENETVLLCGGGLGNAVLFSIGKEARARGNKVLYFAGYKKPEDFYKREEIEAGADVVVYAVDTPPLIEARRPQDLDYLGNIVQAMLAYAEGRLGPTTLRMCDATRLIAIGSDRMMAAVAAARHSVLAPHLSPTHIGIASINSPMQCMMKEVCAQCLQRHVDPVTKKESFVFSCFNQDQKLDDMDWGHLRARLAQNTLQEKISNLWLNHLLAQKPVPAP